MERLQKIMAQQGIASRRKCEELIQAGKVRVNGKIITELGVKIDPQKDIIEVEGKTHKQETKVYLLLHKPSGTITSVKDPKGRKVVLDLIPDVKERIYPVGRLDFETEGVLLLTNDGDLANRIIHPRYELEKEYLAYVQGIPSKEKLKQLEQGVELEDGMTHPAKVTLEKKDVRNNSWIRLVIHEGRNRQVRRMCEAIGHPVIYLRRTRLGFLNLDGLKKGDYRHLTKKEVERLKQLVQIH